VVQELVESHLKDDHYVTVSLVMRCLDFRGGYPRGAGASGKSPEGDDTEAFRYKKSGCYLF